MYISCAILYYGRPTSFDFFFIRDGLIPGTHTTAWQNERQVVDAISSQLNDGDKSLGSSDDRWIFGKTSS